ncbi:MAG: hypothetical protein ACI31G_03305 [Bacilli bacterium]
MNKYKKYYETDKLIKDKLASLIKKYKDIELISVKELVDACHISRSTFYSHYQSIKEVIVSIKDDYIMELIDSVKVTCFDDIEKFILNANKYLKANDEFIKKLFSSKNTLSIALGSGDKIKQKLITAMDENKIAKHKKEIYLELSVLVDGYIMQLARYYIDPNSTYKLKDIHLSLLSQISKFRLYLDSLE